MTLLHQAAQKAVEAPAVHDAIREAGGIVHSDGNIFFTNAAKFMQAVAALQQQPEPVAVAVWWPGRTMPVYFDWIEGQPEELRKGGARVELLYTAPPALQQQEVPREPVAPTATQLLQAVARGWCHEKTSNRVMDPDLAIAIAAEVNALLAASPSTTRQQEARCGSHECKAAQQDGVICADGECDIVAGQRSAAPSTPEKAGGVSDQPKEADHG